MICWDLIWGYYRRNWWHWVTWTVHGLMWVTVLTAAKLDFKFFIIMLATQHPLNMEQVGDVYRKLPISRSTLIRTLNFQGIFLDLLVFGGLMLLFDLIFWFAGQDVQLWGQLFWLAVLLVFRCVFHGLAMREAFAHGPRNPARKVNPNSIKGVLFVALMLAFVGCGVLLKEFIVTPALACVAGVGTGLACWKTTRAMQGVMEKAWAPKPAWKTGFGFMQRQRLYSAGDYFLRGVVVGCVILLILLLLLLGKNRKGLDAFQLLTRVVQEASNGSYNVFFCMLIPWIATRASVWTQSMRLLRSLPWNARQHNWFIVRQFVLWDLGFMMPWLAAMLITVTPNQKLLLLPLVGACGLCMQLGGLWLTLRVTRQLMEVPIAMFIGVVIIMVFSFCCALAALSNKWTVLPLGTWAFLAGALCLWLFRAIERAIRQSSIPYRRQAG